MEEELKEALELLAKVIGLARTPQDNWSDDDNRVMREARDLVLKHRKEETTERV